MIESTLVINTSSSYCSYCGHDANPMEKTHKEILGWTPGIGCGATFVATTSDYADFSGMYDNIRAMRPDLPFYAFGSIDRRAPGARLDRSTFPLVES